MKEEIFGGLYSIFPDNVTINSSTFPTLGLEVLQNNAGLVIYQLVTLGKLINSSESQLLLLSSETSLQDVQEHCDIQGCNTNSKSSAYTYISLGSSLRWSSVNTGTCWLFPLQMLNIWSLPLDVPSSPGWNFYFCSLGWTDFQMPPWFLPLRIHTFV